MFNYRAATIKDLEKTIMKDISKTRKISIIGTCGTGKSSLALRLGELLDLPVCHIDCIYHKPGGAYEEKEIVTEKVKEISKGEKWIIEGTYGRTLEHRFTVSDLVIFLNFPQEFCIESVKNRQGKPGRVGLPEYFVETDEGLDLMLSYHITQKFPQTYKEIIKPLIEKYKEKVVEFTTRKQVTDFLDELKACLRM